MTGHEGRNYLEIVAKAKLRRLIVDGIPFLWNLRTSYQRVANVDYVDYTSLYSFRVYLEGCRSAPAIATFQAWESAHTGGPLHTGLPVDLRDPDSPRINLNQPRFAAQLIRLLKRRGWTPEQNKGPFEWAADRAALDEIWALVDKSKG